MAFINRDTIVTMDTRTTGRVLGAVLAGGLSTRFGSDKAQALLHGRRLIDHAVDRLATQCDTIVVGRQEAGHICVPDRPRAHMGPLGGLAGALAYAADHGYDAVLSCGVDSPSLPLDLLQQLAPAPAYLKSQPVIGLWPITAVGILDEILSMSTNHAVRHFADAISARPVDLATAPANVNRPADLEHIRSGML